MTGVVEPVDVLVDGSFCLPPDHLGLQASEVTSKDFEQLEDYCRPTTRKQSKQPMNR